MLPEKIFAKCRRVHQRRTRGTHIKDMRHRGSRTVK